MAATTALCPRGSWELRCLASTRWLCEGPRGSLGAPSPPTPDPSRMHVFTASPGAGVPSNQIPKLPEDVAADLHHVLMAGGGLECLEVGTGRVSAAGSRVF